MTLLQLTLAMLFVFSWSVKSAARTDHEIASVFVEVRSISTAGTRLKRYAAPPYGLVVSPMRMRSLPSEATVVPKESLAAPVGLMNVASSVPLVLNRNAAPVFVLPRDAPMSTRSLPTAATDPPNRRALLL